jgi:hypothetical protein
MPDDNQETTQHDDNSNTLNPNNFLSDLTDGRIEGKWESRYDIKALNHIKWEKRYLLSLLFLCLFVPAAIRIFENEYLPMTSLRYTNLNRYLFSLFGGTLGGTLFSMKWLVHGVAKNTWNYDRQLWRIFTPLLSGGLALVLTVLINCQIFEVIKPENLSIHKCYGIGFLVGYFSDNAIGKLTEIAQVLFGSSTLSKRH